MSVRWLSYQSFQYSQQLISALNTVIIDLKLRESGKVAGDGSPKVLEAFRKVDSFLESFGSIVSLAEQSQSSPALGTSARMRQLGMRYLKARRKSKKFQAGLFTMTIDEFRDLLRSNAPGDRMLLVSGLEEMRTLIEEHFNEDISEVVGEG
jgi:hypothetical protein